MRPGKNFILFQILLIPLALLIPLEPLLAWMFAACEIMAFTAAVFEYVLLARMTITVERPAVTALSLNENETLPLMLNVNSAFPVRISVRQVWPDIVTPKHETLHGTCLPGHTLKLDFSVHSIARGSEPVLPAYAVITIWGLAERITPAGKASILNVVPNLHAVRRLHIQLNQFALRGLGNRITPRIGKGREFDRLRDYTQDDYYRDIAWKASARYNKLITREYRIDRSQDILICLDNGHRMAAQTTEIKKIDHSVNASMLLSYICNRMEDRTGILAFNAEVDRGIIQGKGNLHLRRITEFVTSVKAEYFHTDYLSLAVHIKHRLRHRALIIIITDLPEKDESRNLIKAVKLLTPPHLPLILSLADPALKATALHLPSNKEELCRNLAANDIWLEHRQTIEELRRGGALVVETTPHNLNIDSVNAYIDIKKRQLI